MIKVHIFEEVSNKTVTKRLIHNVPRVGDEIRIGERLFYKVTRVVWCMDEDDTHHDRANIGVIPT